MGYLAAAFFSRPTSSSSWSPVVGLGLSDVRPDVVRGPACCFGRGLGDTHPVGTELADCSSWATQGVKIASCCSWLDLVNRPSASLPVGNMPKAWTAPKSPVMTPQISPEVLTSLGARVVGRQPVTVWWLQSSNCRAGPLSILQP